MVKKPSYTELQAELDTILADLQTGNLPIDEAVKSYERGQAIITQLEDYLEQAENRITKIKTDIG